MMRATGRRRARPGCERLEGRQLLAGDLGYVLSGTSWANPAHITYSIAPDGVFWDQATNTLNADLDARFGNASWQRELARALQTWATVANIDIVQVGDSPLAMDVPGLSQGDPRFGDIRIGGYHFGNTTTLAQTYYPPPQSLTEAGDTEINTSIDYHEGTDIDLYSVMLHEVGHALGLMHSPDATAVMNATYGGVRSGLQPEDIAGIRTIYGARVPDALQSQGLATAPATADDLTGALNPSGQETVNGVSLATIGDAEYFSVVAPAGASGLQVAANAGGISLLSPKLTILDSSLAPLATAGDPSSWGDAAGASISVTPGRRYYVEVSGATNDVFAVGAYQLGVNFQVASPSPTPPPPVVIAPTPTPTPSPITPSPTPTPAPTIGPDRFEPNNSIRQAAALGVVGSVEVDHLTIDTPSDVDFFRFQASRAGVYRLSASGMTLRVFDAYGRPFGAATGTILVRAPRAGQKFTVEVSTPDGSTVADYSLAINPATPAPSPSKHPARVPKTAHVIAARHPAAPHGRAGA